MQDYSAFGARVEWHPLVTQSLTLITNLHDGSNLVQTQLAFEPTDAQHVDAGYVRNLGEPATNTARSNCRRRRRGLTTGGGSQWYLRWTYYW